MSRHGRADVELLLLQALRQLLAELLVFSLAVGGDDGQRFHPMDQIAVRHELLEVVRHNVPDGRQETVVLEAEVLVARPGPQRGAAARGQEQRLQRKREEQEERA